MRVLRHGLASDRVEENKRASQRAAALESTVCSDRVLLAGPVETVEGVTSSARYSRRLTTWKFRGCSYRGRSWNGPFPARARCHAGHARRTGPFSSEIACGVQVRVYTKAAGLESKSRLPGPIGSFRMLAPAALPAPCRLVVDEAEKLCEGQVCG